MSVSTVTLSDRFIMTVFAVTYDCAKPWATPLRFDSDTITLAFSNFPHTAYSVTVQTIETGVTRILDGQANAPMDVVMWLELEREHDFGGYYLDVDVVDAIIQAGLFGNVISE